MKIIYGATKPDAGEVRFDGQPVHIANPQQARALGIAMVFQHFSLFETLSVAENVWLGLDKSLSLAEVTRRICESLAAAYAGTLDDADRLSGRPIEVVHVVGGGSQNALLNQLTADRSGRPVMAGPVEATAIGNILVQARTAGLVGDSLEDLRQLVAKTFPSVPFSPLA